MRMLSNVRVYVAGPYSNGDKEQNTHDAIKCAENLLINGFVPFVPHLTHFWDAQYPHGYTDWIAYDLKWLKQCDCMYRMPGDSPGADMEECVAMMLELPIFYEMKDIMEYYEHTLRSI